MTQRTYFKIGVYFFLFIVAVVFYLWWLSYNAQRYRDYERLGDLRVLQAIMTDYYGKFNTYVVPQCVVGSAISSCLGNNFLPLAVDNLKDPIDSGSYKYLVGSLSDSDFQIDFSFEQDTAGSLAGRHMLTKNGIR
ncbi:MAG: hypothetical protein WC516_00450 [Patescibacteria group bacterium]